jgi:chromosome segregation ATPase
MLPSVTVTARHTWTDERLDDLNNKVDQRFDEVDQRFDRVDADIRELGSELRGETGRLRDETSELRKEMKAGFDVVNTRIDSLQRTMVVCFTGMTASIVAAVIGASAIS